MTLLQLNMKKIAFYLTSITLLFTFSTQAQNSTLKFEEKEIPEIYLKTAKTYETTGLFHFNFEFDEKIKNNPDLLAKKEEFVHLLSLLHQLRDRDYQTQVLEVASGLEGLNLYHDFAWGNGNVESNTCVNGWCQVMSGTDKYPLYELASGEINFKEITIQKELSKKKPNLKQKKPKYIHVLQVLRNLDEMGFVAIDLDLAQRGDFAIQYYKSDRYKDGKIHPQHISTIDKIIRNYDGSFELRDWHEGIENQPFVYRTGSNMESSFNNLFLPENVAYMYQGDFSEREVKGKNPNISRAFAYFGNNVPQAKAIIQRLNFLRGELNGEKD